ncbi:MAG: RNase adapter RapZ [Planktomarina sp.]|nr:RNase adapter RapZ [Planktomarina sp.]MDT2034233.1 RNase adapter RapZ [Planktomarina sp.]MDT2038919.1 RNase adapter RapZ [Planktomarina sp.]MDT2048898.1 RNase adapter RapZ [Planktomarina sp.]
MTNSMEMSHVVLVTGPSGAGRTTAINFLEDAGFEAIDNVPLTLAPRLFEGPSLNRPLALGLDTRNRDFSAIQMMETIEELSSKPSLKVEVLYIDCAVDVLIRRFSETRRRHHLSPDGAALAGIQMDLDLMQPARARANILIDTTTLSPHELRAQITQYFVPQKVKKLAISVQSFSYKRGVPRGVDMMFDCRFLRNPYWDKGLSDQNGLSTAVQAYVSTDKNFLPFRKQVLALAELVIPAHQAEGRSYLSIGFGCTGGKHRSVTMAEKLRKDLQLSGWHVSIRHRELAAQRVQRDDPDVQG